MHCVILNSGKDKAGRTPEEGAVGPAFRFLHLGNRQVRLDLFLVLDQARGVLDGPLRPLLRDVQHLDMDSQQRFLLVLEDRLDKAEPATTQLRQPVAH